MKKSFLILLVLMLATQVTFAQKEGFKRPKANPELQKEMRTYIEENVQPVLLKAQQDFDSKLSAEDLSFIKEKREQAAAMKAEMMETRKKAMELRKEGKSKEEIHEALGIEPGAKKEEHKAEREVMKSFMEKNQDAVKESLEALKPSYETWVKDQKAIIQKYVPEQKKQENGAQEGVKRKRGPRVGLFGLVPQKHFRPRPEGGKGLHGKEGMSPDERKEKREKMSKGKEGHGQKHGRHEARHGHGKLAVEFVLWDGTLPPQPEENVDFDKSLNPGKDVFSLQNYPNPANGVTKITAELPQNTKLVKITLQDASGKIVKDLSFKNVDKGTNTFDLDVSNLTDGLYFYTFDADGQKTTKRLVVGK